MSAYLKIGDIKGESQDSFEFKDLKKGGNGYTEVEWTYAKDNATDGYTATDDLFKFIDRHDGDAGPLPAEEVTLGYTEVEWTY